MGGGLMQLVAYGAQDIYLTGNPQITFFKVVYRRHTNFAVESIEQTFNGAATAGNKFSCTISRNGDLLHRVYLEVDNNGTTDGFDMIEYVEVEIGGQCIDKHYGDWMSIWTDLTHGSDKKIMLNSMLPYAEALTEINTSLTAIKAASTAALAALGATAASVQTALRNNLGTQMASLNNSVNGAMPIQGYELFDTINAIISGTYATAALVNTAMQAVAAVTGANTKSYIPLQFWFCRNPGLALPLIALQYHEVKINVQFDDDAGTIDRCCVFCDYIFLDTDERRRFAQVSHEYLIEQVQFSNELSGPTINVAAGTRENDLTASGQAELRFNHPVKELVWIMAEQIDTNDEESVELDDVLLQLNGHDRFRKREGSYFTEVQRYEHHTGSNDVQVESAWNNIHLYSFALKPEEHQPSGTCNFSRIDNAVLSYTVSNSNTIAAIGTATVNKYTLGVYAVNYNVLRIMSGMGGLAYSN